MEEVSNIESLPDEILLKIVKNSAALSQEKQEESFPSYLRQFCDLVQVLQEHLCSRLGINIYSLDY